MGTARSRARLAAVQALYQMTMTGAGADAVVREFLRHRLDAPPGETLHELDATLFAELVRGVSATTEELDDLIAAVLSDEHEVDRLETLARVVMRAGAYELSERFDVPAPVAIKEYVDVAEAFYDRRGRSLINAVLDRLARTLRPDEVGEESGGRAPAG
jgi:N utilization substance protein B